MPLHTYQTRMLNLNPKSEEKKRRLEKLDFLCQFVSFSWNSISNQSNAHNLGLNLSRFLPILDQIKTRPPWEISLWLSISLLAFYFLPKSICSKKANKWAIYVFWVWEFVVLEQDKQNLYRTSIMEVWIWNYKTMKVELWISNCEYMQLWITV